MGFVRCVMSQSAKKRLVIKPHARFCITCREIYEKEIYEKEQLQKANNP